MDNDLQELPVRHVELCRAPQLSHRHHRKSQPIVACQGTLTLWDGLNRRRRQLLLFFEQQDLRQWLRCVKESEMDWRGGNGMM